MLQANYTYQVISAICVLMWKYQCEDENATPIAPRSNTNCFCSLPNRETSQSEASSLAVCTTEIFLYVYGENVVFQYIFADAFPSP